MTRPSITRVLVHPLQMRSDDIKGKCRWNKPENAPGSRGHLTLPASCSVVFVVLSMLCCAYVLDLQSFRCRISHLFDPLEPTKELFGQVIAEVVPISAEDVQVTANQTSPEVQVIVGELRCGYIYGTWYQTYITDGTADQVVNRYQRALLGWSMELRTKDYASFRNAADTADLSLEFNQDRDMNIVNQKLMTSDVDFNPTTQQVYRVTVRYAEPEIWRGG